MLPEVESAWGSLARDACESCHEPRHAPGDDGIGCVSCHAATGNHAERDGELVVDLTRGIAGPTPSQPTSAHETRSSGFLTSPSLCGTCHELTGPNLVREPTLTEYRASPAAAAGVTCADCHLPAGEGPVASSHRFVGFDPPWGAAPEEARAAAARTRELLASALDLRVEPAPGGVMVTLANVGAGHAVPTGATFLRDIWVDLELATGARERVIVLGDQPMHADMPVALLTRADRVVAGTLAAGEERAVFVPAEGLVEAYLRGRAVRDEVLAALGREDLAVQVPTHEIQHTSAAAD